MCGEDNVSTAKTDLPEWLNSAAKSNVGYASDVQNKGFTSYSNPMVAGFSPQQTASFGLGSDVANGAAPAIGNTGNWINDYANGAAGSVTPSTVASRMSPYMNQYVREALQPGLEAQDKQFADQIHSFNSGATGAGAFGDSSYNLGRTNLTTQQNIARTGLVADAYQRAFQQAMAGGAQDVSNDINAQTTNANLNEQALNRKATGANAAFGMGVGATNLTNSLGGQQTAADQAKLNAQYNEFLRQQYQDPKFRMDAMNSAIASGKAGADTTTTTTTPNNAGYGLAGSAIGAAGSFLGSEAGATAAIGLIGSDPEIKDNIEQVGELYDGTPVHRFNYKDDPATTRIGLMSPEVTPDAVDSSGPHDMVDYNKATEGAAQIGRETGEQTSPIRGDGAAMADGGLADQLGASPSPEAGATPPPPPLFMQSAEAAAPQPPPAAPAPAPSQSPARGMAPMGAPRGRSNAQQDLNTLADMRDNPGQTISKLGGVGIPIGAAVENAASPETRRIGQPLNAPKPKPETKGAVDYPNSSSVFDLLAPSSAAAAENHDPRPAEVIPEPTQKEAAEIARINTKIDAQKPKLEKAIKTSQYRDPTKDPAVIAVQTTMGSLQSELDRVEGHESPLGKRRAAANADYRDELKGWNDRQADLITKKTTSELPYAVKYPERQSWLQENMPKISAGTGAAFGLLGKGKMIKPTLAGGAAGAAEGAATAAWPTLQDSEFLPPGENWNKATGRIFNGDESSKDFWKRVASGAVTHGMIGGGAAAGGAELRNLAGQVGQGASKARDWWNKPPAQSEAASSAAPAAAAKPSASKTAAAKAKVEPEVTVLDDGTKLSRYDYPNGRVLWRKNGKPFKKEEAEALLSRPPRRQSNQQMQPEATAQ